MLQWNIESQYHNLNDIICDFAIRALCLYTQMFQAHQSIGCLEFEYRAYHSVIHSWASLSTKPVNVRCQQSAQTALSPFFGSNEAWSDVRQTQTVDFRY